VPIKQCSPLAMIREISSTYRRQNQEVWISKLQTLAGAHIITIPQQFCQE